jgi:hypothetical protein
LSVAAACTRRRPSAARSASVQPLRRSNGGINRCTRADARVRGATRANPPAIRGEQIPKRVNLQLDRPTTDHNGLTTDQNPRSRTAVAVLGGAWVDEARVVGEDGELDAVA